MADPPVKIENSRWGNLILQQLDFLRQAGRMCDIAIKTNNGFTIPAHACVLMAASPALNSYLRVRSQLVLEYGNIDYPTWNRILTFIYSGEVTVPLSELVAFRTAAITLGIQAILDCDHIDDTPIKIESVVSAHHMNEENIIIGRFCPSAEPAEVNRTRVIGSAVECDAENSTGQTEKSTDAIHGTPKGCVMIKSTDDMDQEILSPIVTNVVEEPAGLSNLDHVDTQIEGSPDVKNNSRKSESKAKNISPKMTRSNREVTIEKPTVKQNREKKSTPKSNQNDKSDNFSMALRTRSGMEKQNTGSVKDRGNKCMSPFKSDEKSAIQTVTKTKSVDLLNKNAAMCKEKNNSNSICASPEAVTLNRRRSSRLSSGQTESPKICNVISVMSTSDSNIDNQLLPNIENTNTKSSKRLSNVDIAVDNRSSNQPVEEVVLTSENTHSKGLKSKGRKEGGSLVLNDMKLAKSEKLALLMCYSNRQSNLSNYFKSYKTNTEDKNLILKLMNSVEHMWSRFSLEEIFSSKLLRQRSGAIWDPVKKKFCSRTDMTWLVLQSKVWYKKAINKLVWLLNEEEKLNKKSMNLINNKVSRCNIVGSKTQSYFYRSANKRYLRNGKACKIDTLQRTINEKDIKNKDSNIEGNKKSNLENKIHTNTKIKRQKASLEKPNICNDDCKMMTAKKGRKGIVRNHLYPQLKDLDNVKKLAMLVGYSKWFRYSVSAKQSLIEKDLEEGRALASKFNIMDVLQSGIFKYANTFIIDPVSGKMKKYEYLARLIQDEKKWHKLCVQKLIRIKEGTFTRLKTKSKKCTESSNLSLDSGNADGHHDIKPVNVNETSQVESIATVTRSKDANGDSDNDHNIRSVDSNQPLSFLQNETNRNNSYNHSASSGAIDNPEQPLSSLKSMIHERGKLVHKVQTRNCKVELRRLDVNKLESYVENSKVNSEKNCGSSSVEHRSSNTGSNCLEKNLLICCHCKETFKSEAEAREHVDTYKAIYSVRCKLCKKFFYTQSLIHKHLNEEHNIAESEWNECCYFGDNIFDFDGLIESISCHLKSIELNSVNENDMKKLFKKGLSCQFCSKYFDDDDTLISHMSIVHPMQSQHRCKICNVGFATGYLLKKHNLLHQTAAKFRCDTCMAEFFEEDSIKFHLQVQKNHGLNDITTSYSKITIEYFEQLMTEPEKKALLANVAAHDSSIAPDFQKNKNRNVIMIKKRKVIKMSKNSVTPSRMKISRKTSLPYSFDSQSDKEQGSNLTYKCKEAIGKADSVVTANALDQNLDDYASPQNGIKNGIYGKTDKGYVNPVVLSKTSLSSDVSKCGSSTDIKTNEQRALDNSNRPKNIFSRKRGSQVNSCEEIQSTTKRPGLIRSLLDDCTESNPVQKKDTQVKTPVIIRTNKKYIIKTAPVQNPNLDRILGENEKIVSVKFQNRSEINNDSDLQNEVMTISNSSVQSDVSKYKYMVGMDVRNAGSASKTISSVEVQNELNNDQEFSAEPHLVAISDDKQNSKMDEVLPDSKNLYQISPSNIVIQNKFDGLSEEKIERRNEDSNGIANEDSSDEEVFQEACISYEEAVHHQQHKMDDHGNSLFVNLHADNCGNIKLSPDAVSNIILSVTKNADCPDQNTSISTIASPTETIVSPSSYHKEDLAEMEHDNDNSINIVAGDIENSAVNGSNNESVLPVSLDEDAFAMVTQPDGSILYVMAEPTDEVTKAQVD